MHPRLPFTQEQTKQSMDPCDNVVIALQEGRCTHNMCSNVQSCAQDCWARQGAGGSAAQPTHEVLLGLAHHLRGLAADVEVQVRTARGSAYAVIVMRAAHDVKLTVRLPSREPRMRVLYSFAGRVKLLKVWCAASNAGRTSKQAALPQHANSSGCLAQAGRPACASGRVQLGA